MGNEQFAIEVIGFMHERARQEILSGEFEKLAGEILCSHRGAQWTSNFFAKFRNAQAPLGTCLFAFCSQYFRVDQDQLLRRIFLKCDIDYGDPLRNTNLRRC
jgi:hypothetical protein